MIPQLPQGRSPLSSRTFCLSARSPSVRSSYTAVVRSATTSTSTFTAVAVAASLLSLQRQSDRCQRRVDRVGCGRGAARYHMATWRRNLSHVTLHERWPHHSCVFGHSRTLPPPASRHCPASLPGLNARCARHEALPFGNIKRCERVRVRWCSARGPSHLSADALAALAPPITSTSCSRSSTSVAEAEAVSRLTPRGVLVALALVSTSPLLTPPRTPAFPAFAVECPPPSEHVTCHREARRGRRVWWVAETRLGATCSTCELPSLRLAAPALSTRTRGIDDVGKPPLSSILRDG